MQCLKSIPQDKDFSNLIQLNKPVCWLVLKAPWEDVGISGK